MCGGHRWSVLEQQAAAEPQPHSSSVCAKRDDDEDIMCTVKQQHCRDAEFANDTQCMQIDD